MLLDLSNLWKEKMQQINNIKINESMILEKSIILDFKSFDSNKLWANKPYKNNGSKEHIF